MMILKKGVTNPGLGITQGCCILYAAPVKVIW